MRLVGWLCALLLFPGLAQAGEPARFTAQLEGELVIGPQGQVLEVAFKDAGWLGDDVRRGYEAKVREWKFAPVLVQGQPISARGRMRLELVAERDDEARTAQFAIQRAVFLDPETYRGPDKAPSLRAPLYPRDAALTGVGALVVVAARVDAHGKPTDAATEYLHLTGPDPGAQGRRFAGQFQRATLATIKYWTIKGVEPGELVRIPVRYIAPGQSREERRWTRVRPVPVEVPAWVVAAAAAHAPVELADSGERGSARLRLLTPLGGPAD